MPRAGRVSRFWQLEQVFHRAPQRFGNLQGQNGRGDVHAILNGVDAFSRNFGGFRKLLLGESRVFAQRLQVVQEVLVVFAQCYLRSKWSTAFVSSLPVLG